jgi:poly(3-hydroxybutyrate) depolymerase
MTTGGSPGTGGSGTPIAGTSGSLGGQSSGGQSSGGSPSTGGQPSGGNTSTGGMSSGGSSGTATKSAGCGKTPSLTFGPVPNESGSNVGTGMGGYMTIQSAGQTRGFAIRLPANYDKDHPYPLIFAFHWNGGTSDQVDTGGSNGYWWAYYGLQRKSNNGAIFVAPQGLGNGWPNTGGRDLTFTDDMVKLIEDNLCVDTTHIITSGFSYGGGMSYEIACARAKVFRAAVIYEGGQLSGCDGGNDPIALWQVEGLTDTTVNMGFATPIRDRFVKNNGCTAQNPPQPPQPPPYLANGGHICTDYAGCSTGHPVRWCVSQSGHGPGPVDGTSDLYNSCATPPKSCSDTCKCTWTPDDVWSWLNSF